MCAARGAAFLLNSRSILLKVAPVSSLPPIYGLQGYYLDLLLIAHKQIVSNFRGIRAIDDDRFLTAAGDDRTGNSNLRASAKAISVIVGEVNFLMAKGILESFNKTVDERNSCSL